MDANSPPATDASLLSGVAATSSVRNVNGVRLHTVAAGDEDDPLIVLLHGFPEFWYTWRKQIRPIVEAGYRVLVPDQRGYNLSQKPHTVRAYRLRHLSRDIVDLIDSEGRRTAHVVGHDWGGAVAWDLAYRYPDVVDRLGIINAPHPTAFRHQLLSNPEQLKRSWYTFAVQLPWLPERLCRYDDFRLLERALHKTAPAGTFTDDDLSHYRLAWEQDGALTAMLNWYRATARYPPNTPHHRTEHRTLVIWGQADDALVPELGPASRQFCEHGRLESFPDVSHWVPHERPGQTTELLLEHVSGQ